jgi:hypothetical protein
MLAVAGCAGHPAVVSAATASATARTTRASSAPATATPGALPTPGTQPGQRIVGLTLDNPNLTVTTAGLYLTWYRTRPNGSVTGVTIVRADAATGVIAARRDLAAGLPGVPLLADGSLWVTDSTPGRGRLLRLNPATLAVTGSVSVGGVGQTGRPGQVAYAGDAIWLDGGGLLVRVAPASMTVALTITFPGADDSSVGASPDGAVLVVAETRDGVGAVQRRDPVTGAVLASSATDGVISPAIAGVTDGGVWLATPTGMMGFIERLAASSLSPVQSTRVGGTNGIRADVADGALWVTDPVGGGAKNYCADPVTGRVRAASPLPDPGQDQLLAVGPSLLYYTAFDASANGWRIATAPVPAACA